jgi:hypothetical protein
VLSATFLLGWAPSKPPAGFKCSPVRWPRRPMDSPSDGHANAVRWTRGPPAIPLAMPLLLLGFPYTATAGQRHCDSGRLLLQPRTTSQAAAAVRCARTRLAITLDSRSHDVSTR